MIHGRQKHLIGGLPQAEAGAAVGAAIHKLFLANAVPLIFRHDVDRAPMPRPPHGRRHRQNPARAEGEAWADGRNHVRHCAPSREVIEATRPSHIDVATGASDLMPNCWCCPTRTSASTLTGCQLETVMPTVKKVAATKAAAARKQAAPLAVKAPVAKQATPVAKKGAPVAKKSAPVAKKGAAPAKKAAAKAAPQVTITLKHIAAELAEGYDLSKKQAEGILGDVVALTTRHLKNGDKIRLAGLGILQVRNRAARMGRNPATGEAMPIKASKKIAFRPAKELKQAI